MVNLRWDEDDPPPPPDALLLLLLYMILIGMIGIGIGRFRVIYRVSKYLLLAVE